MSFYSSLAATTLRLITDKGQTLSIKRIAKTFDPITSTTSAATKTEGTIEAVAVNFSSKDKELMEEALVEALTKGRLRKLIVAASGLTMIPTPLDVITFESDPWIIRSVAPLNPAGTPLLYYVVMERTVLSTVDAAAT